MMWLLLATTLKFILLLRFPPTMLDLNTDCNVSTGSHRAEFQA